ncbi:hypothetical protein DV737_g1116, partial [Chaetothyriales sp. CBS 132003]
MADLTADKLLLVCAEANPYLQVAHNEADELRGREKPVHKTERADSASDGVFEPREEHTLKDLLSRDRAMVNIAAPALGTVNDFELVGKITFDLPQTLLGLFRGTAATEEDLSEESPSEEGPSTEDLSESPSEESPSEEDLSEESPSEEGPSTEDLSESLSEEDLTGEAKRA